MSQERFKKCHVFDRDQCYGSCKCVRISFGQWGDDFDYCRFTCLVKWIRGNEFITRIYCHRRRLTLSGISILSAPNLTNAPAPINFNEGESPNVTREMLHNRRSTLHKVLRQRLECESPRGYNERMLPCLYVSMKRALQFA